MRLKNFIVVLFLCLFLSLSLAAQDTTQTGAISGKVTDVDGSPLPGVTVTITSTALIQVSQARITTNSGSFRFVLLSVGKYQITFELEGFKTLVKEDVGVAVRRTTNVNANLEMTTLEETVTVVGEVPVVDLKSSTIATNFTVEMLQKIPSARDPWVLMEMTPGMVMNAQNVGGLSLIHI